MAKKEKGPDQPRSWAIAVAALCINTLLSGISRATGLFYVALIDTYGVSRMAANMPFTLRNVVRNLAGPLVGAIGQKYGARGVTFVGGILGFLGITLCTFAPNVIWIAVFWGGIHGLGVALGNTLFPIVVNQYFLKYRATASGFTLSGACIGSFVFPSIIEYMLVHIGLSGTFMITGGFLMHVLPGAILMVEPSWVQKTTKCIKEPKKERHGSGNKTFTSTSKIIPKMEKITEGAVAVHMKKIPSADNIYDIPKKEQDELESMTTRNGRVFSRDGVDNPAFDGSKLDITENTAETSKVDGEFFERMRMRTLSVGESSMVYAEKPNQVQETSLKKAISYLVHDPMFYVISVSLGGFAMLFDPAITVIVDYIEDKGLQEDDAKYFISMMSLGDLVGRLCFGWVTDRKYMTLPKFMLLLQVIQGLCFLLLPLFYHFDVLLIIMMIYGLASGANLVLYPLLISKYLPSVQSLAVGFVAVFTGILSFAVPPLIGYFRDHAGSYDGMFLITGGLSVAAGFLWLFEPLLVRFQKTHHSASVTVNT